MNVSGLVSLGGAALNLLFGGKPGMVIGGVALSGLSAPSSAPFGGKQTVVRHELPGGVLVLNAMGAFRRNFEVSGTLQGNAAVATGRKLEVLMAAGKVVKVTWGDLTLRVLLESVECEWQRMGWEIPYKVVGHVVPTANPEAAKLSPLQQFAKDAMDSLGLTALQPALSQVTSAMQQAQQIVPLLGAISPGLAAQASGFLAAGTSAANGASIVAGGNLGGFNLVASGVGGLSSTVSAGLGSVASSAQTAAAAATARAYLARSQKSVTAAVN